MDSILVLMGHRYILFYLVVLHLVFYPSLQGSSCVEFSSQSPCHTFPKSISYPIHAV